MSSLPTRSPRSSCAARSASSAALFAVLSLGVTSCGGDAPPPALTVASASPLPAPIRSAISAPIEPAAPKWPGRDSFDFAPFVPDNAVAYFEVRSVRDLEEAVLRVQTIAGIESENANIAIATGPMSMVGVDPSRIDRGARIAIAYAAAPGQLFPSPVIIAPAMDEEAIEQSSATLAARQMMTRRVDAGYVVVEHMAMHKDVPRGGSPLVHDLPKGLVQGRFASDSFAPLLSPALHDLADRLNEAYRLSRPRVSAQNLYEFDANEAIRLLTSMEVVAVGLSLEGDQADVRLRVARSDGVSPSTLAVSSVHSVLGDLAPHVNTEDPLSVLFALNPETTIDDLQAQWDEALARDGVNFAAAASPLDAIDDRTRAMLEDSLSEAAGAFHPGAAVSLFLEPAKAHVAIYLSARDKLRARESVSSLLSKCELDTWGFEMALPLRSMIDSTLVEDYSVRFDSRRLDFDQRSKMRNVFKTFLGDSTLHVKVATAESHVLVVIGGDTTAVNSRIRAFAAHETANPYVTEALEALDGADSASVVHADFVKFVGQIAGVTAVASGRSVAETAREIAREVGDASAPFTFWSGTVGQEEVFGTTFNLEALTHAFDALKGSGL